MRLIPSCIGGFLWASCSVNILNRDTVDVKMFCCCVVEMGAYFLSNFCMVQWVVTSGTCETWV